MKFFQLDKKITSLRDRSNDVAPVTDDYNDYDYEGGDEETKKEESKDDEASKLAEINKQRTQMTKRIYRMVFHMIKAVWGNQNSIETIVKDFIMKLPRPEDKENES